MSSSSSHSRVAVNLYLMMQRAGSVVEDYFENWYKLRELIRANVSGSKRAINDIARIVRKLKLKPLDAKSTAYRLKVQQKWNRLLKLKQMGSSNK